MNITPTSVFKFSVWAVIAAVIGFVVWYFSSVVIFILVSAVVAIIGRPLVRVMMRLRVGSFCCPRWLAAVLTLLVMWFTFGVVMSFIVPLVMNKIYELATLDLQSVATSIERPLEHLQDTVNALLGAHETQLSIKDVFIGALRDVVNIDAINAAVSSVLHMGLSALIAFLSISFISFFFMKEDGLFTTMVMSLFPEHYHRNVMHALEKVNILLVRYFTGVLAESTIITVVVSGAMALWGMRIDDAFFIGVMMGVLNTIPYAGPFMGGVAAVFIGIVAPIGSFSVGATVAIIVCTLLTVKGLDDFVMQPAIYSQRVKAHPLEIFLVILIAGYLAGVVGMLLAIPSYTVLRVFAKEFFSQYALVEKLTSKV